MGRATGSARRAQTKGWSTPLGSPKAITARVSLKNALRQGERPMRAAELMPYAGGTKGRVAPPNSPWIPKAITARVLSECTMMGRTPYAGGGINALRGHAPKGGLRRPTSLWTPKGANSLLDPLPRGYPRHDLMACLAGQDKPYVGHGTRYRKREARTDQGVVNSPWIPKGNNTKSLF